MNRQKTAVVLIIIAVFANSGCSMFARRQDPVVPEAQAFTNQVSTDSNDLPLPVEINQDIGKIVSGGGHFEGAGGNGKVNVNVNVNFNGNGWQQNVPGANGRTPSSVDSADTAANVAGSTGGSGGQFSGRMATGEVHHRDGAEKYVVKSGDTLMKISFEKYGSVYRWREILAANQGRIANAQALVAGTELTIDGRDYVVVERNGKAYLIMRNDTLGKISRRVYGTPSFWRDLWKNNPQLIHNPNKIYAGFTLYYRDRSELGAPVTVGTTGGASGGRSETTTLPEKKRSPASPKKK